MEPRSSVLYPRTGMEGNMPPVAGLPGSPRWLFGLEEIVHTKQNDFNLFRNNRRRMAQLGSAAEYNKSLTAGIFLSPRKDRLLPMAVRTAAGPDRRSHRRILFP